MIIVLMTGTKGTCTRTPCVTPPGHKDNPTLIQTVSKEIPTFSTYQHNKKITSGGTRFDNDKQ